MNVWNYWPKHDRNASAMGAALALLVAILSMLSLRCNPVVGEESVVGLVLVVEAEGLQSPTGTGVMSRVVLAVADTTEIMIFLPPPVPRVGDFVPLTAEIYKNGNISYYLDGQKWLIAGPRQSRP